MPTPQSPRNELITATGWRIVGRAASELAEQGAQEQLLAPPDGQTVVFALRCTARPLLGSASALPEMLRVLSDEVRERDDSLPPLTRDRPVRRDASRFGGLHWDVEGDAGAWTGELLWRQPHPVRSGIACLTHVILREQGSLVTAAVRVACESLGARIGPIESGQAKPRFLAEWHARTRLSIDGRPVAHHLLNESDVERFAEETLLSESRSHPIAVLAPLEDGSFVVPPTHSNANSWAPPNSSSSPRTPPPSASPTHSATSDSRPTSARCACISPASVAPTRRVNIRCSSATRWPTRWSASRSRGDWRIG